MACSTVSTNSPHEQLCTYESCSILKKQESHLTFTVLRSDSVHQASVSMKNSDGCCLQIFDDVPPGAHWHCVRTVNMQPRLQVHCFAIDHKYTHTPYDGVHLWNGLHIVTATDDGMHLWDMGSGLLPLRPPLVFSKELAIRGSQVLAVLG